MSATPGNWFTTRPHAGGTIYVEARIGGGLIQEIAAVGPTADRAQQLSNANLLCAAPDLRDALQTLARWVDQNVKDPAATLPLQDARNALLKAIGEQA